MSRVSAPGRQQRAGQLSPPRLHHRRRSPSPPPRRNRHRHGDVVERVVEKSSAGLVYPVLTRTNYTEWSLVMRVNLQAAGLWRVIEIGVGTYNDDRHALAALLRAVPLEMQAGLAVKETAAEAWDAIRTIRVGVDRVKEANAEKLRQDFNEISFKPGESVEDFTMRINTLANELRVLGDDLPEKEVVRKMLHSVPEQLETIAISIDASRSRRYVDRGGRRAAACSREEEEDGTGERKRRPPPTHGGGVDRASEEPRWRWIRIELQQPRAARQWQAAARTRSRYRRQRREAHGERSQPKRCLRLLWQKRSLGQAV